MYIINYLASQNNKRKMAALNGQKEKFYFAFVDLEKAFDRVPLDVVQWAICNLGVEEWLEGYGSCVHKCQKSCQVSMVHLVRSLWLVLIKDQYSVLCSDQGAHKKYYMLMILC